MSTTKTNPTQADQEWALRQCGGWTVDQVPCGDILRRAGYELDRGCWRRAGEPAPSIGSTDDEMGRIHDVAREMGLLR